MPHGPTHIDHRDHRKRTKGAPAGRGDVVKQEQVAEQLGVSKACVNKWSQRFEREGLEGLKDRKGRGRPPSIPADKVEQVITRATQPPKPRQRWSVRTMAKEVGISPDSVHRIWRANDIKPHRVKTFKLSNDQRFGKSSGISLDSTSIRLRKSWCFAALRRVSAKPWSAPNRVCL